MKDGRRIENGVNAIAHNGNSVKIIGTSFATPRVTSLLSELNFKINETFNPVSYTHLDVYKRQPVDNDTRLNIADIILPQDIKFDVIVSEGVVEPINNFISLVNSKNEIKSKGLDINLSLLLYGPPGCGKTTLAKHIAKELDIPIVVARFDSLISSLLGSTAKNIRKLFDYAKSKPCILFLDEFDACLLYTSRCV